MSWEGEKFPQDRQSLPSHNQAARDYVYRARWPRQRECSGDQPVREEPRTDSPCDRTLRPGIHRVDNGRSPAERIQMRAGVLESWTLWVCDTVKRKSGAAVGRT